MRVSGMLCLVSGGGPNLSVDALPLFRLLSVEEGGGRHIVSGMNVGGYIFSYSAMSKYQIHCEKVVALD